MERKIHFLVHTSNKLAETIFRQTVVSIKVVEFVTQYIRRYATCEGKNTEVVNY
jgi:hypothetical protein